MCFSAEASFVAAAAVGSVGVVGLRHIREPRELVLGTLPLAFAVHQAVEGVTWRQVDVGAVVCQGPNVTAWVIFAWAVVPVWLALGVTLCEPDARRRRAMGWIVAAGLVTAPVWLWQSLSPDVYAQLAGAHLEYPLPDPDVGWLIPVYLLVTLVPPLLSTQPWLSRLGVAGVASAVLMVAVSTYAWPSLWCFAAALLSALIVAHLRAVSPSPGAPPAEPSSQPAGWQRRGDAPSP